MQRDIKRDRGMLEFTLKAFKDEAVAEEGHDFAATVTGCASLALDYLTLCEHLERMVEELRARLAKSEAVCDEMRGALELAEARAKNDCDSCKSPFKEDDTCQFPNLLRKSLLALVFPLLDVPLHDKTNTSHYSESPLLLERLRQAESIIKRFAEFDHMLIRKAVCKECGESPCKGDDKVLCVYKDLIADIDAFLKGGGKDA